MSAASNTPKKRELIEEARKIVNAPYTRTIPWTGSSKMQVPCGPSARERKFAQAFLDAVGVKSGA